MDATGAIKKALQKALAELGVSDAQPALEFPADLSHGDFATNVAMVYGKELKQNPKKLAEEIVTKLGVVEGVSKIEVAGPGFINFHLAPEYLAWQLRTILDDTARWGAGSSYADERVMVEYTDPNPFKAFHIGHLMSNTIGESLARLIENAGATVVRANYQGDVGVHVASSIWGIKKLGIDAGNAKELGRAYAVGATAYKEDAATKTEIDDINKKLYARSDDELNKLYDTGRKASLDAFERIYAILGTKFDSYFFESETGLIGQKIVAAHPDIFPESEGARVFKGEEHGLHTRVFISSQGIPIYEAKELGLEKLKMDRYPELSKMIVVTANEITEYFKVVKKALELVYPEIAAKLQHVPHGMMRLTSGKMSSRTGNVITGEALIASLVESAKERSTESRADDINALAQQVAVAAIKYQVLKQATGKDSVFDEERSLSIEGDSGPYVQYAHARARALLEKGAKENVMPEIMGPDPILMGSGPILERLLMRFPAVTERAVRELSPHHVTGYVTELAGAFNSWYAQEQILGQKDTPRKLAVVAAVAATLQNGLHLLGISAPEKM